MAAVKALAKLVKNYGPSMGRVIHDVAEETGIAASKVASMIRGSGPLKSKFDFETIFYHGTPSKTLSRKAASRGHDVEKVLKDRPEGYGKLLSPFEEIAPSRGGALGPGTYLSRNPFWSLQMAVRKGDPRMVSKASPRGPNEPSIIPYILKKGWKGRLISKKALDDAVEAKRNLIDDYMMSRYHNIGKSTNPKLYEEIIKPVSEGGRLRSGWLDMTRGKKKTLRDMFKDTVPRNERRKLTKKYKEWLKNPRYEPEGWHVDADIKQYAKRAVEKSLAKEGKIGIYKPASAYWPEEHLIFPGLEKEWLRHPLARFQKEIGGTFASLLPLISLLRGKREE